MQQIPLGGQMVLRKKKRNYLFKEMMADCGCEGLDALDLCEHVRVSMPGISFSNECVLFPMQGFVWPTGSLTTTPKPSTDKTLMDLLTMASSRSTTVTGVMMAASPNRMDAASNAVVSDELTHLKLYPNDLPTIEHHWCSFENNEFISFNKWLLCRYVFFYSI